MDLETKAELTAPSEKMVAITGAGTMGRGIAQAFVQNGFKVKIIEKNSEIADSAKSYMLKGLGKLVELGKITEEQRASFAGSFSFSNETSGLKGCSLIIEAVNEDLTLKQNIFVDLRRVAGPDVILASNTSTLSINEIAASVPNPERVIGLHFFNPAEKVKLVEVIPGSKTAKKTLEISVNLMREINKTPIVCKDYPGFIINRLLLLFINESIKMSEEGITAVKDIDQAVREGLNHPMGPFELADLIGLDILYDLLKILGGQLGDRYSPPAVLKKMVEEGSLGRKSKKGFYDY
ncbi:MAG: 3-hydroxyacyl-CoA dehydrogenase family protein [Actinobacteria bacterium]|nr:3-hydroxyacyl-CoA dehydrogenase family protein [Actinomycetota bacterium]